ncbi:NME/NM23 nucleoside diphosphate kinase 2a isoform X2 [Oncorhynchus keta]|uniref:NME/NM23 nucleoside diphosphate kinase 2a isoform X2 n=1 Tax=Oncorhynchus keta TaxID=8018 RepID=UPI0015FC4968|nr:NME/NM23 nucleoside diphosphate kinase 2a isoform X2 [Oncorhynchus keta]
MMWKPCFQPVFAQWAPPCVKPISAPAICIGITESTALAKITCPAPCQSLTRRISCQAFSLFSLLLISCPRSAMSNEERTFIAIKPDGVQRRLVGEIIKRFELKGFKMVGMKFVQAPESLLREHYADLEDRPFFPGLVSYMTSGPVVAMVGETFLVVFIDEWCNWSSFPCKNTEKPAHCVGRVQRGEDRQSDAGRDQPCRLQTRHHPRGLLHPSGQEHHPWQ